MNRIGEDHIRRTYRSIQEIVFTALMDDILRGTMKPGEKLTTGPLAERYGVSRTPVREALARLRSIGLIENIPHRGAFVRSISIPEIMEIYYIRGALSGTAARFAVPNLTSSDIEKLLSWCDRMEELSSMEKYDEMLAINTVFHDLVTEAAGLPRLKDLIDQYYRMSAVYRTLGLWLPGRGEEVCREHRNIVTALRTGDLDKAEQAVREHYFNTARRIAESAGARGSSSA